MKKLFFLLTVIFIQIFPQTGWVRINNLPTTGNFKSVRFVDSTTGWIAGEYGVIISTTNGGVNWTRQTTGTIRHLNCIYFAGYSYGWAVGDSGIVLRTSDGGANWVESSFITKQKLRTVFFVDRNNGWIAGDSGVAFRTTNNGLNWINSSIDPPYAIKSIFFNDLNNGWLVDQRTIWRTTNSGLVWTSAASITGLNSIYFSNLNTGWAVGGSYSSGLDRGLIYKTSNGGQSWFLQIQQPTDFYYSVYAHDSMNVWVAGIFGGLLKTTDGGTNWLRSRLPFFYNELNHLYSIYFSDSLRGWVVGGRSSVFKTTDGGIVSIEDETPLIEPTNFRLEQNYPNPFNPVTKIKFSIPKSDIVKIRVYDVLGKEIQTLLNDFKTTGTYEIEFDAGNFPSGVYFYRLISGSYSETKKMILLR